MRKLFLLLFIAVCCLLSMQAVWAAETGDDPVILQVNPYGGEADDIDTIRWYAADGKYYLFLPADTDPDTAVVYFSAPGALLLDGKPLISGASASALTPGSHELVCGDASYALVVCQSAHLPAVFLGTESCSLDYIHASKENKEPGNIRVYENGVLSLDNTLKQIKGRGNSTWAYRKKPYNIKFDKKTDLLGMGKAKKWTLLANYIDLSLLHNAFGWEYAEAMGLGYTSDYRYVDLYVNGDYLGNYVICESVELGENRIDLPDLDKANEEANPDVDLEALPRAGTGPDGTVPDGSVKGSRKWVEIPADPADISGAYLLEYDYPDRYDEELCGFVTQVGQPVVVKSPEYASRAQVNYIADRMDAGSQALYSPTGYNAEGRHYSEYFDVDSLVAAYLLQELSMNFDAGLSSFYAYKPADAEKIFFGPVWDMDNAFGSPYSHHYVPLTRTDLWYANELGSSGFPSFLAAAYQHADFRDAVRAHWASLTADGTFDTVNNRIARLSVSLRQSAAMNGLRWNFYQTGDYDTALRQWQEAAAGSMGFVLGRIAALNKGFAQDGAYLYYDLNGGYSAGWVTVTPICSIGERVTVRDINGNGVIQGPEGLQFYCWNTRPDGTGEKLLPGNSIVLEQAHTVLYAIWKTQREIDRENGVNPFADVAAGKYYYDPVLWAYYHEPQITSGTNADLFSPGAVCTREQVTVFLHAAYGKPEAQQTLSTFSDVTETKYFYTAVMWAVENGITSGVGNGLFGVGRPCTREQVVTFLWKAAGAPAPSSTDCPFTDVREGKYYYMPVLWALENGVTSGVNDTTFGVGRPCTRAQVVSFLYAALGKVE